MLIKLQDFKEGEIVPVQHTYDPRALDMEFVDLRYTRPLQLSGTVEKGLDTVTFKGHLSSQTELICGRCLKPLTSSVEKNFDLYYEIKGREVIDATDDIREILILDHSLSYVCNENCRGLCAYCGINLNETSCECASKQPASLSQLKDIWKKKDRSK